MALSRERKVLQSGRELLRIPWHLQREISKTIYALAESAQEANRLPRSVYTRQCSSSVSRCSPKALSLLLACAQY